MKKVFFIINCYSKGGGAESLLTKIVNNLDETKYEIGIMEIIHDNDLGHCGIQGSLHI